MQPMIGIEVPIPASVDAVGVRSTMDVRVTQVPGGYRADVVAGRGKDAPRTATARTGRQALELIARLLADAGVRGKLRVVR